MGLARIDEAIGAVDGANRVFATPFPYVAGTLIAILNGRQLDDSLDNGWVELDPNAGTFELKVAPSGPRTSPDDPGDLVSAYYENAFEPTGGGADGGIPRLAGSGEVRPRICQVSDIRPRIAKAEEI